jgi:hypothetical protein
MTHPSSLIIYSKSVNTSYTLIVCSFVLIIFYACIIHKLSNFITTPLKYTIVGLLSYATFIILNNNYKYISSLQNKLFLSKNKNLRNTIVYNSFLAIFIILLIYHFIYF